MTEQCPRCLSSMFPLNGRGACSFCEGSVVKQHRTGGGSHVSVSVEPVLSDTSPPGRVTPFPAAHKVMPRLPKA